MKRTISLFTGLALLFLATTLATAAVKYVDGVYSATYDFVDGHGWKPQIEITIKGGKIVSSKFDYVSPDNKLKSQDQAYAKMMTNITKKVAPAQAYAILEKELLQKQSAEVDSVSGASTSSEFFKATAASALLKAEKGDKNKAILPMNESYTSSDKTPDKKGFVLSVTVTYRDGKIVKVVFDGQNKDKKTKKSVDTGFANESGDLEKKLIDSQSVDKVAPAKDKALSGKFIELSKAAIASRI